MLRNLWSGSKEPRVEELDTEDEDSDSQGVGLSARHPNRVVSDSLRFTGVDLGDRNNTYMRREYNYADSEDDDDSGSATQEDETLQDSMQLTARGNEQLLLESALKRIQRAQAKGKADVKLNKEELAALERQHKRIEAAEREAERERRRSSGSGTDRKGKKSKKHSKEERVTVPIAQLDRSASTSRKKSSASSSRSRKGSPSKKVYPPMGYFPPPPPASRSRAGTTGRTSQRSHEDSPPVSFRYRPSAGQRHVSDPHMGMPQEHWSREASHLNPFQYQTAGPGGVAPYPDLSQGTSRRHASGPSEVAYSRSGSSALSSSKSQRGSRRPSRQQVEEPSDSSEEQTSSDDLGNGAQIREPRGRDREIIVEVSPERAPTRSKKKSSSSPTKRKPVPTILGRRKKK